MRNKTSFGKSKLACSGGNLHSKREKRNATRNDASMKSSKRLSQVKLHELTAYLNQVLSLAMQMDLLGCGGVPFCATLTAAKLDIAT